MKKYITKNKMYSKNVPGPWYVLDDPFSSEFKENFEYCLTQVLDNGNKITYHFDSRGFRKSFDLTSNIWFFGCSHVFGEAVENDFIFPKLVSESLGNFYNFGTCGASLDLVARLLYKLRNKLSSKTVVILLPHYGRIETIIDNYYFNAVPKMPIYKSLLPESSIENFINYKTLQATMLIDSLTANSNRIILSTDDHKFYKTLNPINISDRIVDKGLDNAHFGIKSHRAIADLIIEHLK